LQGRLGKNALRVINLGVPGYNSSMIANRFDKNIKKYHPAAIIILMGSNDDWNPAELDRSLISKDKWEAVYYLESLFYRIKTFRLIDFIWQGINNKITRENQDINRFKSVHPNRQPRAGAGYNSLFVTREKSPSAQKYIALAKAFHRRGDYDKSVCLFKKAIKLEPENLSFHRLLCIEYGLAGQYANGFKVCQSGLRINKNDMKLWLALFQLAKHDSELLPQAETLLARWGSPEVKEYFRFKKDIYRRVFLSNLGKIVAAARENGDPKIVLCNYPYSQCSFNDQILKAGRLFGLTTVNFQEIFAGLRKKNGDNYYFVPDWHCNDRGYEEMAKNLLPYVETAL